jgi:Ca-activated chloride channel homolog
MMLFKRIAAGAFALLVGLGAADAGAAERTIIILDGSGSMWAQIDGEARITVARETLADVLDSVPDDLELGFMTYGHRAKGDCADIELLVEPAAGTADAIREAADGITPLGKTPISDAVRLAAEHLKFTEEKATVILITDGIESCEADPLHDARRRLRTHRRGGRAGCLPRREYRRHVLPGVGRRRARRGADHDRH